MKILAICRPPSHKKGLLTKIWLVMKLTAVIMLVACLQVGAKGLAQKVTISERNVPIKKIFREINRQTGYLFFYYDELLPGTKKIDVQVTNASLEETLDLCFKDLPFTYEIIEKTIVVKAREPVSNVVGLAAKPPVKIHGVVADANGKPVPGVSILVQGTTRGTSSNEKGEFTIEAEKGEILKFSSIGFQGISVIIKDQQELYVSLHAAPDQIGEVVVVGYGTQRRGSVTGAVDQIKPADIQGKPATNLVQALQGVSPNLIIQQSDPSPGAAFTINVRGIGTMGDNSPLVVIDGITGGDISLLNPNDIESISILKDAGAAAIYGSRSSNGIILITTKKGIKNTRPTLNYSGNWGMQHSRVLAEPLPAWQNAIYKNESLTNVGQSPIYSPSDIQQLKAGGDHEWFLKSILHNAPQQSHNVSVTGGGQNSTYLLSVGGLDQESNFVGPNYGYRRYNIRLGMTAEYDILKVGGTLAFTHDESKTNTYDNGFLMADAERVPTNYMLKDSLGRFLTNSILTQFNPLGILENGGNNLNTNDVVIGNINAEIAVTKNFKLRGVFGGNLNNSHGFYRQKQVDFYPSGVYGNLRTTADNYYQTLFTNTQLMAEFAKRFRMHSINVLFGAANESTTNQGSKLTYQNTDSALGIPVGGSIVNTSAGGDGSPNTSLSLTNQTTNSLNSLFGRAKYDYDDKYLAEFNFRYDGSSKFAKGHRWGFFPSVAIAWRATEEDFLASVKDHFGDIKVRGSYGILGNQNVVDFQYQTTYFSIPNIYGFSNNPAAGTGISFSNPLIQWERAATFNTGVDVVTLAKKLSFSLDYFNKLTSHILVAPTVPGTFGASLPTYNAGKVRNVGWEFSVKYSTRDHYFTHSIAFNIADNQNTVIYFQGGQQLSGDAELQIVNKIGVPYHSYVGYKRAGFFQTPDDVLKYPRLNGITPQPGDYRYKDKNGDGIIDNNDLYVLGNPFPRYTFGLNYSLGYKNFDLGIFMQGVGKRTIFVRGELVTPYQANYSQNIFKHQLDFWTPTNPNAKYPLLSATGSASNQNDWGVGSDAFLFNAAYLRVKNVQLGYTLPQRLAHRLRMQKLRAYFTGQNLLTFTGVKFLDPESSEFDQSLNQSRGSNNSGRVYPTPVFYGAGLDVTF